MSEPLKVWRRAAVSGNPPGTEMVDPTLPLMCGGPDLTTKETEEWLAEQRREEQAAEERAREEQENKSQRHPSLEKRDSDKEDDEYQQMLRYRNDRYAVKLLRQDDSVWGGTGEGPGVLG
jgi:hypothetical protein